ncbi:MAG: aminopeptidase [Syntrophorhabdales bacterium]|jgi:aspartyl aminopeptidase
MERQSGWKRKSKEEIRQIFAFSEGYKQFLDAAKTEREAAVRIEQVLRAHGFTNDAKGPMIYGVNRGKEVIAFRRGSRDLALGMKIVIAHIDAPRLDLKQSPLYEDVNLALLRTHYYGGIKKYQWVAMPLAVHGVVVRADGSLATIVIGEDDRDPVFSIDDLLPHLSRGHQDDKKLSEAIDGEKLTVLFGGMPLLGEEQEPVKKAVLGLLAEQYAMVEEDFISAEIEVVPAFRARDVGIDRSMVGAYGQDDRASAYPLLAAITDDDDRSWPVLAIFSDKEEIGSEGNTGAQSHFIHMFVHDLMEGLGLGNPETVMRRALFNSKAISADVNGAVNPGWQEVHEKQNACYLGGGICMTKFTGHGGKVGANDANAEYVGEMRSLLSREGITWQTGELGKIDEGGGGTVAKFLAEYGMDIIDMGAPLLTMHSPFEISSKLDIYETYRTFRAFFAS